MRYPPGAVTSASPVSISPGGRISVLGLGEPDAGEPPALGPEAGGEHEGDLPGVVAKVARLLPHTSALTTTSRPRSAARRAEQARRELITEHPPPHQGMALPA